LKPTLFLDRDGVINKRIIDGYVCQWSEFVFEDNVLEALSILSPFFHRIIVVTNQQGIGKGLMTEEDFCHITEKMKQEVTINGGRIDCVLHCSALECDNSFCRKPKVGMGLQARKIYPEIRFKNSVMVGDSLSDMLFGKWLKMNTVLIADNTKLSRKYPEIIDRKYKTLKEYAQYVKNKGGM
jgi:D,D-heptose 1,7-bisphosphate phosphatase